MDSPHDTLDDVSALAWVQEELRKSLDTAHKALRRTLKETESTFESDLDDVEPTQLRTARQQIHQGVGVLELVGLPAGAALLRGSEAAVQRYISKPHKLDLVAVETIERASFALHDFLARRLAGKPVSSVALFPQYRAVQELAGAERIHPADLWPQDWQWHVVPTEPGVAPRGADAAIVAEFESQVLTLMRKPGVDVTQRLSDLSAGLAVGSEQSQTRTLWQLAAAFFEAQSVGLLVPDVYAKRMTSRLLAQLRSQQRGDLAAGERLARDLHFFCTQAAAPAIGEAPRLQAVRSTYPATREAVPSDYNAVQLGRYDPAWIAQARKRVATAKDSWSAVAGGEMHRLPGLNEQFALVADSLKRLVPSGDQLGDALLRAVGSSVQAGTVPPPALAMETATSVLYLEAALEDGAFDQPEQAERVQRLAQRVDAVLEGAAPEPLETWMEELYRRVSDRQTMGSVVQELRASLSESEKLIDQFFRAPTDPAVLMPVPAQLQAMRGVMSVLGLDQATHAVLRMRDDVDTLVSAGDQARHEQPLFERLAGNLSALSFMIDLLGVQPQVAKSLFRFDAASGLLSSQLGRHSTPLEDAAAPRLEPSLIAQAQSLSSAATETMPLAEVSRELERLALQPDVAAQPDLVASLSSAQAALDRAEAPFAQRETEARVREQVVGALAEFVSTASDPIGLDAVPVSSRMPLMSLTPAAPVQQTGLEGDDEMREIFLEEAREVLDTARSALAALSDSPGDVEQLTTVRRSFHTFKGSSRMVGLREFGEASWACEQLYNDLLASQQPASDDLLRTTGDALDHLGQWVEAIARGDTAGWHSAPLRQSADAMRLEGRYLSPAVSGAPAAPTAPSPVPPGFVLPPASDLDLPAPAAPAAEKAEQPMPVPGLDFTFDLGDALPAAEPPAIAASALPTIEGLEALDPAPAFEHAATEPLPLEALPSAVPVLESITTFDLEVPELAEELVADPAAETPALIEPLLPSADVLQSLEPLPGVMAREDGTPAVPFDDVADSDTMPFESGDIVVALEPSRAGELSPTVDGPVEGAEERDASTDATAVGEPTSEQVKIVGPLQIGIPLFNIYLNEADELSRRLGTELSEWAHELHRPVGESAISLAHSLAGSSATVGFGDLSLLARQLEHALVHSQALGGGTSADAQLYVDVADEVRRLLHQFAAGFLKSPSAELLDRLALHELDLVRRVEAQASAPQDTASGAAIEVPESAAMGIEPVADALSASAAVVDLGQAEFKPLAPLPVEPQRAARMAALDSDEDIDAVDAVDPDLFPFFEEEAQELLPELATHLRAWTQQPHEVSHAAAAMRTLHTLKGGARLAGAMRLGELAHRLETAIEHLLARDAATEHEVDQLLGRADGLNATFEALCQRDAQAYAAAQEAVQPLIDTPEAPVVTTAWPPLDETAALDATAIELPPGLAEELLATPEPAAEAPAVPPGPAIDWARFAQEADVPMAVVAEKAIPLASVAAVRVRTQLLDRMVNEAGEVSIARARLESQVGQIKNSLGDLTDNLERLRGQLRDIELQAETQMSTRMEAAKAAAQSFDPLEFDRFTRFQELTRMMAESVNDVATVQRTLQRTLETAEDELAAQARLTRDLQDDLLRTRMVEFEGLSDRLYRVVRQAAKETGKQVRLDIIGGSIEVDRGVLDRMTGAFEHLLRNCITHGIESPELRTAAGKDPIGTIVVSLHQEGNEVSVEFRDDGAGLNLPRIRDKAASMGLIDPHAPHSDAELANLIFTPGFTTAEKVTELSGRGVGMDVVRAEVNAVGGRIETASAAGQGASFRLILPLTTAVTQVVMLRSGNATVAIPATLVELVRRANTDELAAAYASGSYPYAGHSLPFFWLGALLQLSRRGTELVGRSLPVVVVRSAQQRVALHVDEVLGNQEVVVKNLGPQLSRLPGLAGMTLLASGVVSLIYNPVALATVYGDVARQAMASHEATDVPDITEATAPAAKAAPLVLVVDDSLTVRRVTQRLLVREGYRVLLAKDGLEALERLAEERPSVVLSDIEMPRMDGFDLVRNIRADAQLAALPVIMITSRIAQKHRDYASQLGVNHYLGKPYSEEELLALIGRYCTMPLAEA
ncbi:hybrid sensor histidine kinase/response regulator [Methylibium sp. Pch-M]|uniref:hybrid sensor histidine kinase/response regulator n=1 Tax=Methylibium sp. Pch-M TaxID=2082386 RepID=UPI001013A554|nr:Hpt domain-containing protein [Methylibium sp. Pch-M]QAZ38940.1 hybrid sensor histidine kinase/response regulator [Methylibium sp. Pch-M]